MIATALEPILLDVDLTVEEYDICFDMEVEEHDFDLDMAIQVTKTEGEAYPGPYTVIPAFVTQTLPTTNKVLHDDVTVVPIPVSCVGNTAGGNTIFIGGIFNA